MRQVIGWSVRDAENRAIRVEASRNRNQWTFRRRGHRREDWETFPPEVADWEALLDVLERKYQRRRCAWRDVEQVTACLEHAKATNP